MRRILFIGALLPSAYVLYARWGMPLASPHAFRETETAMPVYWMLHGGGIIRYWTPVVGPPWNNAAYEFPTFQIITAGLVYVLHASVDNGGRLCSWLFLLGGLLPLRRLARRYDIDPDISGALYLASPLGQYWGTCFLIETCSVTLCLMFLMFVEEERWKSSLLVGVLAAITKIPTFVPFLMVASLRPSKRLVLVAAIAITCAFTWNSYTDHLKAANPLSAALESSQPAQKLHNFGTLHQRLDGEPFGTMLEGLERIL